ncbi:MAG: hypothetical protein Q9M44_07110, partial [Ghiorsea sp.]|nr:hypothetical protein [Ghiorsea sp.]
PTMHLLGLKFKTNTPRLSKKGKLMSNTFKLIVIAFILSLMASCSAKKDAAPEPAGIAYKTSEITVRQCSDIGNAEFNALLEKHEVSIKKQMSPHLYIVTWDDDRHADEVVKTLNDTTMFCGVDKYQSN